MTEFIAVIGRGFGDEGKGLCTDFLARTAERPLVIRHNGGAQSGHTVELPPIEGESASEKRFVFHELSSGSFRRAVTFWAKDYMPDLYKLSEELSDFRSLTGFFPDIYADKRTCVTTIDDVLLNMLAESLRGDSRHGSCGMGINEADIRKKAGYCITVCEIKAGTAQALFERLLQIRREYTEKRILEIYGDFADSADASGAAEYLTLLKDENVLRNAAAVMHENAACVQIAADVKSFLAGFDRVIFESGQGLLLDADNDEYAPHVTASKTGLTNICGLLKEYGYALTEAIYVTRSYVTRHGAGTLHHECTPEALGRICPDRTNMPNPWQGSFRYAFHEDVTGILNPIKKDLAAAAAKPLVSLLITHLNETDGVLKSVSGDILPQTLLSSAADIVSPIDRIYLSDSPFSESVRIS